MHRHPRTSTRVLPCAVGLLTLLFTIPAAALDGEPDGDGDGISDGIDNCLEVANRSQLDADLDGFGDRCDGDFDGSGVVDALDFTLFLADFATATDSGIGSDVDANGSVDAADFTAWLPLFVAGVPGPSGLSCAGEGPCGFEEGFLPMPEGPFWATYSFDGDYAVYQGDIAFELTELRAFQAEHADDPHPVTVWRYAMSNGDHYAMLDHEYDGDGDGTTPASPLSGGLGRLADGITATASDYGGTSVGWWSSPTIRFDFTSVQTVSYLRLHVTEVEASGPYAGMYPTAPKQVIARMGGRTWTTDIDDFGSGERVILVAPEIGEPNLEGSSLELTLVANEARLIALSEVEIMTGNRFTPQGNVDGRRWPQTIPYFIAQGFSGSERNVIRDAIADWQALSDFTFVEIPAPQTVIGPASIGIRPTNEPRCRSIGVGRPFGLLGINSVRWIELNRPDCVNVPTVLHEVGHALGLKHEQQRKDRNDYVTWYKKHTRPGKRGNFETKGRPFGSYDYLSIMHYGESAFERGVCCSTSDADTSGGQLPNSCEYFDRVRVDIDMDGERNECPSQLPFRSGDLWPGLPWLVTLESVRPLPEGMVLGVGDVPSKTDVAAANSRMEGQEGSFAAQSFNALFVPGTNLPRPAEHHEVGDVDGDGRDDLVAFLKGDGSRLRDGDVFVALGQPDGSFGAPGEWHNWFCVLDEYCHLGDVDGDGDDDIIGILPNGEVNVAVSDGTGGFFNAATWKAATGFRYSRYDVGDVDGDCREDLLGFNGTRADVYLSAPGSFVAEGAWGHAAGIQTLADVDADGDADIVSVDGSTVWVAESLGNTFATAEVWAELPPCFVVCPRTILFDVDGDDRNDLVLVSPSGGEHHTDRVRVMQSTGWRFADEAVTYHELDCRSSWCLGGDVNGDGVGDVVDPIGPQAIDDAKHERVRGNVWVSTGTELRSDPIGARKPVFGAAICNGEIGF